MIRGGVTGFGGIEGPLIGTRPRLLGRSRRKLAAITPKHAPRMGAKLAEDILAALDEQTVTVAGTGAADKILPRLADGLKTVSPATENCRRSRPHRRCH